MALRRNGANVVDVFGQYRPVAGPAECRLDGVASRDLDQFLAFAEIGPSGGREILAGIVRVHLFDIEILIVDADIGVAPGEIPVSADDDCRDAGNGGADHALFGEFDMDQHPDRRRGKPEMRVIRQQGRAGGRAAAVDGPGVGGAAKACSGEEGGLKRRGLR